MQFQSIDLNFNPFQIKAKENVEEKQQQVRRKPKTLQDYKLYLVNGDKDKWIDNHRTKQKKVEIENIKEEKEMMDCITYMRRIKETNLRTQKPLLRKIEEELIDKVKEPKERNGQDNLADFNKLISR